MGSVVGFAALSAVGDVSLEAGLDVHAAAVRVPQLVHERLELVIPELVRSNVDNVKGTSKVIAEPMGITPARAHLCTIGTGKVVYLVRLPGMPKADRG